MSECAFNVEAWPLAYGYLLASGGSCKFLQLMFLGTLPLVRDSGWAAGCESALMREMG